MNCVTTLNAIERHRPCKEGWNTLLTHLSKTEADDEPLPLATVLESNQIEDATWCLRALPEAEMQSLLFAVWCARRVQRVLKDLEVDQVMDVVEKYVQGKAVKRELRTVRLMASEALRYVAKENDQRAGLVAARYAAWEAIGCAIDCDPRESAWLASSYAVRAVHVGELRRARREAKKQAARKTHTDKFIEMFCTPTEDGKC